MSCEKCGSNNVEFKREKVNTNKNGNSVVGYSKSKAKGIHNSTTEHNYRTIGMCKNCGNTWIAYQEQKPKVKKKISWIWWVLFFPIPLTITIYRSEKLTKEKKTIYIVLLWLILFLMNSLTN